MQNNYWCIRMSIFKLIRQQYWTFLCCNSCCTLSLCFISNHFGSPNSYRSSIFCKSNQEKKAKSNTEKVQYSKCCTKNALLIFNEPVLFLSTDKYIIRDNQIWLPYNFYYWQLYIVKTEKETKRLSNLTLKKNLILLLLICVFSILIAPLYFMTENYIILYLDFCYS